MVKEELILWNEYPCGANSEIYSHAKKRMLEGTVDKNGYVIVRLKCIDGKQRLFYVHRVIYTYFYGTIPEGYEINHIDENKQNNALYNLNLMTHTENNNWGTRNERVAAKLRGVPKSEEAKANMRGKKRTEEQRARISASKIGVPRPDVIERNKRLCSKAVVAVDEDGNVVLEFPSTKEAGRQGFKSSNVSACCRNCYNKQGNNIYKNFRWYFKKDWLKMKGVA